MDSFINKLIQNNKIYFQSGNLTILGFNNHLFPLAALATFFQSLEIKFGEEVRSIIKSLGERQIKALAFLIFNKELKSLNKDNIELLLKYIRLFGYGNLKIIQIDHNLQEIIFQITNSPYCSIYSKLIGNQNKEVNHFVAGLCQGLFELFFNKKGQSSEIECISRLKQNCYIKAKKANKNIKDDSLNLYSKDLLIKSIDKKKLPKSQTNIIKKIIGHNMVNWEDGEFSVWRTPGFIFPVTSIITLYEELGTSFGPYTNNLLYHIGRIQSRNAVLLQVEVYGFEKNEKLLLSVLEHSELAGFGILKCNQLDFKKKTLSVEGNFNPYPRLYKKIIGKSKNSVDFYLSGMIAGMAEGIFNEPMEAVETKCIAKGDKNCIFLVGKKESESIYKITKKEIIYIEKKINPKNFLL